MKLSPSKDTFCSILGHTAITYLCAAEIWGDC